jgi:hypothetical protein
MGVVVGLVAGVVGTRASATPGRTASTPALACSELAGQPHAEPVAGPLTARLADEDRAALRALMREELAAARAPGEPRAPAGRAESPPPDDRPLTNDEIKAYDRVRAMTDDRIARGEWTEKDRATARVAMATIPPDQRIELMQPLMIAVNTGKVRFDGRGPLF